VSVQPDRCPRCGNTQISYGGGHAAFCGSCGLIADQDVFEVSEE
jgi:ribosomal protein S27E